MDSQYAAGWNDDDRCTSCRHVHMAGEIEWCGLSDKVRSFYNTPIVDISLGTLSHPHPPSYFSIIMAVSSPILLVACRDCGFESRRGRGWSVCCDRCVLSGRGLCDELITRPEGVLSSVVCLSVIVKPLEEPLAPWGGGAVAPWKRKYRDRCIR